MKMNDLSNVMDVALQAEECESFMSYSEAYGGEH